MGNFHSITNRKLSLNNDILINKGANINEKDKMGNDSLFFAKSFAKNKKITALFLKKIKKSTIKQNEQILLNITKRINNIEREIYDIKRDIEYFEQKKINSVLNYIINIFTFGYINKNKNIKEDILIKADQLNKLLSDKAIINNEKQLLEQEIRKIKFNKTSRINAMDPQNKQSTSEYKPSNASHI